MLRLLGEDVRDPILDRFGKRLARDLVVDVRAVRGTGSRRPRGAAIDRLLGNRLEDDAHESASARAIRRGLLPDMRQT